MLLNPALTVYAEMRQKTMSNISLVSLGCAKNLTDSEVMLGKLQKAGYTYTGDESEAEIIIVNTCCFIDSAKQESIDTILDIAENKKTGKLKYLIVAGCMGERYREEVLEELPEVDGVIGTGDFDSICEIIEKIKEKRGAYISGCMNASLETIDRVVSTPPYTAYLKIAEGCSNNCTYCVIPSIRGTYRSRPQESILAEAEKLAKNGVKELILIAQDTSAYGKDLYGEPTLDKLVEKLSEIEGIEWIRIHYLYPEGITDGLLEEFKNNDKLVNYFDIPIQHISDSVLKRMGRRTTGDKIKALINKIRSTVEKPVIRTSLIAGFPGESEEDFCELVEFVREYKLDRVGVFPYSCEEGTPAAKLDGQLDEDEKNKRAERITEILYEISEEICESKVGETFSVIVEGYDPILKMYAGRTYGDSVDVDPKVFFRGEKDKYLSGDFVKVKTDDYIECDLIGEVEEEES